MALQIVRETPTDLRLFREGIGRRKKTRGQIKQMPTHKSIKQKNDGRGAFCAANIQSDRC